ncbi:peptide antibiotic transporter SbmA [Acinetobacter boissieri]|uniref:Peptide/bleomycin uptake transporter n=1 Tax=Acinetobacter boissieri TaxID=1219383 RepID=A0A1G6JR31_9GAMM|nr:peptide antibiotic transporter SbmA [Acinetobacter boissieri]SDC21220.1 peptide/bleomycin uptake transporter [Acinetobacter boissieri]
MFKSFFPSPVLFFFSIFAWISCGTALWYLGGKDWGVFIGFPKSYTEQTLPIGVSKFISLSYIWVYIWFSIFFSIFFIFWKIKENHKWQSWSICGSAFILFNIWFSVQVSISINEWYGPFWNLIQKMLSNKGGEIYELYQGISIFLYIAMVAVTVNVINSFFVSHYIFRWRTAMTEYYTENWNHLRSVEGASQRVQEDTMRFATIMEDLGVTLVKSLMTLIAFLPLLIELSKSVPSLPLIGEISHSLVWATVSWSIFGTVLLMLTGIKLPGLEFKNQKVEAAYRKELVYGEDSESYAKPLTLAELFSRLRFNYFKLYFHYAYFNLVSSWYIQLDIIFNLIILFPAIAAGTMTLGLINQIRNVFDKVTTAFQYLINSWKTIIELLSIRKRLKEFESIL